MQEATYWKRQYENFIKSNLCSRRNGYLEAARLIDDEIENLLDSEKEILEKEPSRTVLFLLINDAFNQEDPIGLYPLSKYEYDKYVWELVTLYEHSDEIGFRWQLPMYLDEFWVSMFCDLPSSKPLRRLEISILGAVSQFTKLKQARGK